MQLAVGLKGILIWIVAIIADSIAWPYFYKLKTANIESDLEQGTASEARTNVRASEMGADRASEV